MKKEKVLAPNDPQRVPAEYRELINNIISVIRKHDFDVFESQTVISSAAVLCGIDDLEKAGIAIEEIILLLRTIPDIKVMIKAVTEIINMKMTEAMNKQKISGIDIPTL